MLSAEHTLTDVKHTLLIIACTSIFTVLLILPFVVIPKGPYWLLAAVLILPFLPVLEGLLLTPLYRASGRFVYYSKMLLTTQASSGLQLHAGTLFDYVTYLRWQERGLTAQRKVTQQLLQGLLVLCEEIEQGNIAADTVISATSYFFSDRTAAKLGFKTRAVVPLERLNLILAGLSLALRLRLTKDRWTWPNLRQIRQIHSTAGLLLAHRATIVRLLRYLNAGR